MNSRTPACELMLQANFGGYTSWRRAFIELTMTMTGKPGEVTMCFDAAQGRVVNRSSEKAAPANAGCFPLLALEPISLVAAAEDDSTARRLVEAAIEQIDWTALYARYQVAVNAASESYAAPLADADDVMLFDVRRAGVYAQAPNVIPGAQWRDPADVSQWVCALPASSRVLAYCVHGHEVSQAVVLRLRAAGVRASYLAGGIDAWAGAGKPLAAKPIAAQPLGASR